MLKRQAKSPLVGEGTISDPFSNIRPSRTPLRTGMEYTMVYDSRNMNAPNVPPPVRRSSLAQTILIHRYQMSKYLSRLRNFGLRPDYPAFHGFKVVHTGNPTQTNPRFSNPRMNTPHSLAGAMLPPKRFKKALLVQPVDYVPETYR